MLTLITHSVPVSVMSQAGSIVVSNGLLNLEIGRTSKLCSLQLGGTGSSSEVVLRDLASESRLADGSTLTLANLPSRVVDKAERVHDRFGNGVLVVVHERSNAGPELLRRFWVYENRPELFTQVDIVDKTAHQSNYLAPVIVQSPLEIKSGPYPQRLFVPYDNDNYFRYRSDGYGDSPSGSYEVGAEYDDQSRRGIVVGSVDHRVWKSAVRFSGGASNEPSLIAFAGAADKYTHDKLPHGMVSGTDIQSPRMVIGWYRDWRSGMEQFAKLNAIVTPPLKWNGPVPFGWNSWAGHKEKVTATDARAATDFIDKQLPNFRDGNTAFINFDSFWDNLTLEQRGDFVKHCHELGLKAGIYYSPFAGWGKLTDKVAGSSHYYSDLALRDDQGKPVPQVDGAYPLDPTQPETIARMDRQFDEFVKLGFDFVKLDFMTLAALEGHHANPKITTGAAAYAFGMQRILDDLSVKKAGYPIFLSLSIAPMFPQGFGHSRRISCDVFSNIGATEYLLNSSAYGWWTNRSIYQFNDPDATCIYQPRGEPAVSEAEARSRFSATLISGGMLLDGDDLTKQAPEERVKKFYSKPEMIALAKQALSFRPIDATTGDKAGDGFESIAANGKSAYVAFFNFSKTDPKSKTVELSRMGLEGKGWKLQNLWTGEVMPIESTITATMGPTDCFLARLSR